MENPDPDLILRVAARGDGITADGRHAAYAAPGDWLRADGRVEPGPHHAVPPCRHFPECGGCDLQHLDEAALTDFVRDRAVNALKGQEIAIGEVRPVHLSPPRTRRRASLRALKAGGRVLLGFNERASHRVIDLAECHILAPQLFALLAPLRVLLKNAIPKGGAKLALALTDLGPDLVIEGATFDGLAGHEALTGFAERHGLARVAIDQGYGAEPVWEPQPVTVTLGGKDGGGIAVPYPPHAFLQATPDGEATLIAAVREAVGEAKTVADLFAGLGTFAFALAEGRRVYAAEADQAALLALRGAAGAAQLPVMAEHRDLYRRPLDAAEVSRFEAVVLDPPRAGAKDQVAQLATSKVQRIAYVSCNPASFAKDAKALIEGGWRLDTLWPVGQFRWSTHVELVGAFSR